MSTCSAATKVLAGPKTKVPMVRILALLRAAGAKEAHDRGVGYLVAVRPAVKLRPIGPI